MQYSVWEPLMNLVAELKQEYKTRTDNTHLYMLLCKYVCNEHVWESVCVSCCETLEY